MIKLENIGKLNGVNIGDWICYMVEEHKDHYTMLFESRTTTAVITQFRLFKEDQIKGLWTLRARMDNRANVVSQFQRQSINDTQALCKDEFQTFDAFCRTLARTLKKFDDILKYGIGTYHTASLSKPHLHNPQQPHPHLGSAASVASVTKRINGGQPNWYIPKEEESNNEHLESLGKFIKYTFWDNTPMGWMWRKLFGTNKKAKQAPPHFTNQFGHQIPMDRPLRAKKAAY